MTSWRCRFGYTTGLRSPPWHAPPLPVGPCQSKFSEDKC
uniref:Uncharacterized protein n=1 Tax=Anguilla anguilla TaxID=7936 RepID=A0A0E9VM58_ANGAN